VLVRNADTYQSSDWRPRICRIIRLGKGERTVTCRASPHFRQTKWQLVNQIHISAVRCFVIRGTEKLTAWVLWLFLALRPASSFGNVVVAALVPSPVARICASRIPTECHLWFGSEGYCSEECIACSKCPQLCCRGLIAPNQTSLTPSYSTSSLYSCMSKK
jgi:hypothetical protein